jgi:hypothetical protein
MLPKTNYKCTVSRKLFVRRDSSPTTLPLCCCAPSPAFSARRAPLPRSLPSPSTLILSYSKSWWAALTRTRMPSQPLGSPDNSFIVSWSTTSQTLPSRTPHFSTCLGWHSRRLYAKCLACTVCFPVVGVAKRGRMNRGRENRVSGIGAASCISDALLLLAVPNRAFSKPRPHASPCPSSSRVRLVHFSSFGACICHYRLQLARPEACREA